MEKRYGSRFWQREVRRSPKRRLSFPNRTRKESWQQEHTIFPMSWMIPKKMHIRNREGISRTPGCTPEKIRLSGILQMQMVCWKIRRIMQDRCRMKKAVSIWTHREKVRQEHSRSTGFGTPTMKMETAIRSGTAGRRKRKRGTTSRMAVR